MGEWRFSSTNSETEHKMVNHQCYVPAALSQGKQPLIHYKEEAEWAPYYGEQGSFGIQPRLLSRPNCGLDPTLHSLSFKINRKSKKCKAIAVTGRGGL
jgi:hypothetical protein